MFPSPDMMEREGRETVSIYALLFAPDERHAIAVAVRPGIDSIARAYNASAKVAEIPPGPPVLSTLVAEVYAGDDAMRLKAAREVKHVFETNAGRSRC
jgi:hypothetical protein